MDSKEVRASLYGQYIKARENFDIIEEEDGFVTYQIKGGNCYVRDIYVVPDRRKAGVASRLCDQVKAIAKQRFCVCLIGSVVPSAQDSTDSLKAVLGYGFELLSAQDDFIVFKMTL